MTDPRRAGQIAAAIAGKLGELDGKNAGYYRERNEAFQKRLAEYMDVLVKRLAGALR